MIDRIPQWFQVRMLVDHRGAQISVTHNVANERWILCLCHRVRAERMSSVVQNNLLGNPSSCSRRAELTRNGCEMAFCSAPRRKHPFASVGGTKPEDIKDPLTQRHPAASLTRLADGVEVEPAVPMHVLPSHPKHFCGPEAHVTHDDKDISQRLSGHGQQLLFRGIVQNSVTPDLLRQVNKRRLTNEVVPHRLAQHYPQRTPSLVRPRRRSGEWDCAHQISSNGIQAHSCQRCAFQPFPSVAVVPTGVGFESMGVVHLLEEPRTKLAQCRSFRRYGRRAALADIGHERGFELPGLAFG